MVKTLIEKVQTLIKKTENDNETEDLYLLMSAVRGCDSYGYVEIGVGTESRKVSSSDLKDITALLRGYLGFTDSKCPGFVISKENGGYFKTDTIIQILKDLDNHNYSLIDDISHYVSHLVRAIGVIGLENFIKYIEGLKK